ncbi:MAG: hypothetical protein EA388_14520 [Nitriliruptor sp.]|nr:MAG: hypothetical protein EA388_14520 [Nitriliruptor sp.]
MERPSRSELRAAASLLLKLAREHGLAELHYGQEPGTLVATLDEERTYFDVARFEQAIEGRLGWSPDVVLSDARDARPGPPVVADGTQAA